VAFWCLEKAYTLQSSHSIPNFDERKLGGPIWSKSWSRSSFLWSLLSHNMRVALGFWKRTKPSRDRRKDEAAIRQSPKMCFGVSRIYTKRDKIPRKNRIHREYKLVRSTTQSIRLSRIKSQAGWSTQKHRALRVIARLLWQGQRGHRRPGEWISLKCEIYRESTYKSREVISSAGIRSCTL